MVKVYEKFKYKIVQDLIFFVAHYIKIIILCKKMIIFFYSFIFITNYAIF